MHISYPGNQKQPTADGTSLSPRSMSPRVAAGPDLHDAPCYKNYNTIEIKVVAKPDNGPIANVKSNTISRSLPQPPKPLKTGLGAIPAPGQRANHGQRATAKWRRKSRHAKYENRHPDDAHAADAETRRSLVDRLPKNQIAAVIKTVARTAKERR